MSFNQMIFNYKYNKQIEAMALFRRWSGETEDGAAERWCSGGCAEYFNDSIKRVMG
jgi:hypothetical protein